MWIKCTDRLPGLNTTVLVAHNNEVLCGQLGRCDEGYMWYFAGDSGNTDHEVTHWMPLPAPPNSEDVEVKK